MTLVPAIEFRFSTNAMHLSRAERHSLSGVSNVLAMIVHVRGKLVDEACLQCLL